MAEMITDAERLEIRLSGSGGQGILLAAAIIADAAAGLGKHVVQSQSYGPAARGGASKAEVIVSDEEIDYPEVLAPEISLCLSQEAYTKYASETRPGGLLLYDSGLADPGAGERPFALRGLPFTQAAADELGKKVVANIVALGALVALGDVLPAEAVEESTSRRVPAKFRELNIEALRLGRRLALETEGDGREPSPVAAGGAGP